MTGLRVASSICKVDNGLGMVFGYAMVCLEKSADGSFAPHFDTQGHHITEECMVKMSSEFAVASRGSKDMHQGEIIQTAPFIFPVTEDIAKAMGWEVKQTGLAIGIKPTPEILAKYQSGEYTGFSIGGVAFEMEEVAEAA